MKIRRPNHLFDTPHRVDRAPKRQRGTILVLVVAVLALLAVIGTVYVVAARSERASSRAMNETLNLKLARDAFMEQVVQVIGNAMIDKNGKVGGYAVGGPARNYDIPDANQLWLAVHMHAQSNGLYDLSVLSPNAFDPAAGTNSLPLTTFPYAGPVSTVVFDPTAGDTTTDDAPPLSGAQSATPDSYMYLLSFSDASGARYRAGIRIIDTNRMANLNTGSVDDAASLGDTTGSYIESLRLTTPSNVWPNPSAYYNIADVASRLHATTPATSGQGRAGLSAGNASFGLLSWHQQIFRYEKPSDPFVAFFDLSDELELRSGGEYGTPYHIRPAIAGANSSPDFTTWPNTLSANPALPRTATVLGNPPRRNYTTVSWSREIRPYTDPEGFPIYTLTSTKNVTVPAGFGGFRSTAIPNPTAINVWPTAPARVAANPDVSNTSPNDSAYYIAMAATNLATAMRNSGFTEIDALSFAANYVAYRSDALRVDPAVTALPAYYLPNGPSFIDDQGICFRTWDGAANVSREFGGLNDVKSEVAVPHKVYLGYSAQPFINEVAANMNKDVDATTGETITVIKDSAVELYNPYSLPMSLTGYQIQVDSGTPIDLQGYFIPANGYFVISTGTAGMDDRVPAPSNTTIQKLKKAELTFIRTGGSVTLLRAYVARDGSTRYGPVDSMGYTDLVTPVGLTDTATDFSLERPSKGAPWASAMNVASPRVTSTLGIENNAAGGNNLQLYCRSWEKTLTTFDTTKAAFTNIADFNRLMRMTNQFDGTDAVGTKIPTPGVGLLSQQLALAPFTGAAAPYTPNLVGTGHFVGETVEAQLHFDFYVDPTVYNTAPPTDPSNKVHLPSLRFLDHIAMVDRVSDFSINVGRGVTDVNKIRIPGQININTASGDVLRALPGIQMLTSPNQAVANILAYRNRTGASTIYGTGSAEGAKTSANFSNYPGRGFRSLAELMIPINVTLAGSPLSLDMRDKSWASLYNLCTVRSDTFAVYGYIEALKVHPSSTAHNNSSDWYGAVSDTIATSAPNLRVARRRWVAIVDRSFCNYEKSDTQHFTLPKVVAIKDLPQ